MKLSLLALALALFAAAGWAMRYGAAYELGDYPASARERERTELKWGTYSFGPTFFGGGAFALSMYLYGRHRKRNRR